MRAALRAARRAVALALLAAFVAVLAAPLAVARDDTGPYCGRGGRCCCAPDAGDERTCLRSECGCGRAGAPPALASLADAILPPRVADPRLERARSGAAPRAPQPIEPDRDPADHPPPHA